MNLVERRLRRLVYREMIETLAGCLAELELQTPAGPEQDRLKLAGSRLLRAADALEDPAPIRNNGSLVPVLERSLQLVEEQKRRLAEAVKLNANHES